MTEQEYFDLLKQSEKDQKKVYEIDQEIINTKGRMLMVLKASEKWEELHHQVLLKKRERQMLVTKLVNRNARLQEQQKKRKGDV